MCCVTESCSGSIIVCIFQVKKLRHREITSASWVESECKARAKSSHNPVLSPIYKAQVSITFTDLYLDCMVTGSSPVSLKSILTCGFSALVGSLATLLCWITHGPEIATDPWFLTFFYSRIAQSPRNLTPLPQQGEGMSSCPYGRGAPWNVGLDK